MHVNKIVIKNYRAIKECEIEFKKGINLLIGDNGVGKTSILDSLVCALNVYLQGVKGISTKGISQEDVHVQIDPISDASVSVVYSTPVEITCNMSFAGKDFLWTKSRHDETGSSKTRVSGSSPESYVKKLVNDPSMPLPILSFQADARLGASKRSDFGKAAKSSLNDRRCGYIGCLDSAMDSKSIQQWCLDMEFSAFQKNESIQEYEAFKRTVASFMAILNELDNVPEIYYSRQLNQIVYRENGTDMPITYLSAGYQALLWMVMDLTYRIAQLNPSEQNLGNAHGIVIIDELDMHLHPKWQWLVLSALEQTFPNIQFIIATHSPILVSSCKNGNLILIHEDQSISYLSSAYGYAVEDVLELCQGSVGIPKELRNLVNVFEENLNSNNYVDAQNAIHEMEAMYGSDNSEVRKAKAELDIV